MQGERSAAGIATATMGDGIKTQKFNPVELSSLKYVLIKTEIERQIDGQKEEESKRETGRGRESDTERERRKWKE